MELSETIVKALSSFIEENTALLVPGLDNFINMVIDGDKMSLSVFKKSELIAIALKEGGAVDADAIGNLVDCVFSAGEIPCLYIQADQSTATCFGMSSTLRKK